MPRKRGRITVQTLWGELAWQLGREDAFALVKDADTTGTSPGKEVLTQLLAAYAPCVVLMDELVAYIRQFHEGKTFSGGTYDSQLSFRPGPDRGAAKLVPTAMLLASLPESDIEAGSQRGVTALRALEKNFGRVQALWKPVATEEAFEIVRRRLFEPRSATRRPRQRCAAPSPTPTSPKVPKLPHETQESRYYDRLVQAYPIHPEVFDRLYEDWTTIDGFQRTRGVLKLMAKVIYRLWKDDNKDLLILPGSLPLLRRRHPQRADLLSAAGWDPVIERDIDGDRAETTELENRDTRFGAVQACRRAARTVFLGSAPTTPNQMVRGIETGTRRARLCPARPADGRVQGRPAATRATACTTSTAPTTASGSTPVRTCAARWKSANGASRTETMWSLPSASGWNGAVPQACSAASTSSRRAAMSRMTGPCVWWCCHPMPRSRDRRNGSGAPRRTRSSNAGAINHATSRTGSCSLPLMLTASAV